MNVREQKTKLLLTELSKLSQLFNRQLDPTVIQTYIAVIVEELTYPELEQGLNTAWKTCRFFPTPADIIELGKTSTSHREDGIAEWVLILNALPNQPQSLTERGKFALQTVGGTFSLSQATLRDKGFLKGDFLAAYETYQEGSEHLSHESPSEKRLEQIRAQSQELDEEKQTPEWQEGLRRCRQVLNEIAAQKRRTSAKPVNPMSVPDIPGQEPPNYSDEELKELIESSQRRYQENANKAKPTRSQSTDGLSKVEIPAHLRKYQGEEDKEF